MATKREMLRSFIGKSVAIGNANGTYIFSFPGYEQDEVLEDMNDEMIHVVHKQRPGAVAGSLIERWIAIDQIGCIQQVTPRVI